MGLLQLEEEGGGGGLRSGNQPTYEFVNPVFARKFQMFYNRLESLTRYTDFRQYLGFAAILSILLNFLEQNVSFQFQYEIFTCVGKIWSECYRKRSQTLQMCKKYESGAVQKGVNVTELENAASRIWTSKTFAL